MGVCECLLLVVVVVVVVCVCVLKGDGHPPTLGCLLPLTTMIHPGWGDHNGRELIHLAERWWWWRRRGECHHEVLSLPQVDRP